MEYGTTDYSPEYTGFVMSRLVQRILLSLLLLPLSGIVYGSVTAFSVSVILGFSNEHFAFLISGLTTWIFIAVYWILLWQRSVRWSRFRVAATTLAVPGSIAVAFIIFTTLRTLNTELAMFVASLTAIFLWVTATVFIWTETARERRERIGASRPDVISCPTCGYNLTGLHQPICPECGDTFTLDELFAAQPSTTDEDLRE